MVKLTYEWTNGNDADFQRFYLITEEYYNRLAGGIENRKGFVPYNISATIQDVLIAYIDGTAVACAGLKMYSEEDAEVKRVWVEPEFRGKHIATNIMRQIEMRAKEQGYKRTILQTRASMIQAVNLYKKLGYYQIDNYPPYDAMTDAICFAKDI